MIGQDCSDLFCSTIPTIRIMQELLDKCCGIDVHQESFTICIMKDAALGSEEPYEKKQPIF